MLKRISSTLISLLAAGAVLAVTTVYARDTIQEFSISDALNAPDANARLDPNIRLYFAGQNVPAVRKRYGEYATNKKTNSFNKSDLVACEWVFLSAILQLQSRAAQLGANAVMNIKSNYKNRRFESPTLFQCGAGNVIAGVALTGEMVTVN